MTTLMRNEASARRAFTTAAAIVMALAQSMSTAHGAKPTDQPIVKDGVEIFYGVMPSRIILGHPEDHSERTMHGGVPAGGTQSHLVVSLFDSTTRQRITDAKVQATIRVQAEPTQRKALEPMQFAGAVTYGNYFDLTPAKTVRIELEVWRPGAAQLIKTVIPWVKSARR